MGYGVLQAHPLTKFYIFFLVLYTFSLNVPQWEAEYFGLTKPAAREIGGKWVVFLSIQFLL